MTDIMLHRGPDSGGFHLTPGVGLGIRRLSIIDLETGDQPISSEDGKVTVVCNGEIYNYPELRRELTASGHRFRTGSDVEVIIHLYEQYGVECLEHLRGMFAAAIWDRDATAPFYWPVTAWG
jgi:asparagine synthase (glutamine-hydrolysing)